MKRLLLFLFCSSLPFLLLAGEDWQPQPVGPFGTLNNRDNSFAISADKAQDLLNVDITPGGKSVKKRRGYGASVTLGITTSPVHGVYNFFDANGNNVSLFFNDSRMTAQVSGSSPAVLFSTGPNGATYQCTDSLGFAYCANTSRTTIVKTNGATYSLINNVTSTGTMVATAVTRLAMAGFSDAPSRIDLSADSDFTTWGTGSLGTSAVQFTINAPGAKITHITYAFGRLMWFKDSSFGYILIGNQPLQSDWVIKTIAYDVGTNDNSSVYREGNLYFRGTDGHFYIFDGTSYQRLSREISGTIALSQIRASNSWNQTSQSDFQNGVGTPTANISFSISPGNVVLTTAAALSSFLDTVSTDFAAGTLTSVSTIPVANSLVLAYAPQFTDTSLFPSAQNSTCGSVCTGPYFQSRRFLATKTGFLSTIVLELKKIGSPGNFTLQLMSDNNLSPGSVLESQIQGASGLTGSVTNVPINFSSSTVLAAGTTYWLQLLQSGCDASNQVLWSGTGVVPDQASTPCGAAAAGGTGYGFKEMITTYTSAGNLVSRNFDVGFTTATWLWSWGNIAYSSATANATISFETQTSADGNTFEGVTGVNNNSPITSTVQRYIRYKASFSTTNSTTTPRLDDVSIAMSSRLAPNGTYYSQVHNAPNLTAWDTLSIDEYYGGSSRNFYIRSSTNNFVTQSSTPAWSSFTLGSIPSISTGTFFQLKEEITSLAPTDNLTLRSFTFNWFEGLASDKAYSTYFNDRILWSIAYGTAASTNNRILLYDFLNQGWLAYDIPSNGFYVKNNSLYFGGVSTGTIFKYGDIDNDAGSPINAYWKSKDFFGGSPFATQEIANVSIAAKSVANSSMTVTYTLNGQTDTSFTMPLYNVNGAFTNKNKNIPAGTNGSEYAIKFGNNAVDQPFEVFGIQIGIRPKTWAPTP